MSWGVRIVFAWQGAEVWDIVGPFDRYFADLVCLDYAEAPHRFGVSDVRVLRAMVVPWMGA